MSITSHSNKEENHLAKTAQAKRGRPRLGEEKNTLMARKPWLKMKPPMSRATWYRRKKEIA